jgi:hypothetical protein
MSLPAFLRQLFDHGRVTVELADVQQVDERELEALLRELDAAYREHLPVGVPPLNVASASWAAKTLYLAAQVLVFRELENDVLQTALRAAPTNMEASEQFSIDLCLRFLPDLVRLARAASPSDPLVTSLLALGADWPLSSLGISGVSLSAIGHARVQSLSKDAAVWQIYVDRVLQTGDASRLADPATKTAVRVAVGAFPQLAGKLQKELMAPS